MDSDSTSSAPKPASRKKRDAGYAPPLPAFRRLRGYAIDPSLSAQLETRTVSEIVFQVPWEPDLSPGPSGEYLEVIDTDPSSGCFYEPVNLNDPRLLAQDGLPPDEGSPQFHQQMVYAVASLTIRNFESALGRKSFWRPGPSPNPVNPKDDSVFVGKLRVYPHALREDNAFYTPGRIALLFGYFRAAENLPDRPAEHMGGSMVFTCLSHDIIAHETTHALLDGMNRAFLSPTNPDVHAFHEAFADLVALFQHFTFPAILGHQIVATRGAIESQENLLGQLAGQFGRSNGSRKALRDAIGTTDQNGVWKPRQPHASDYESTEDAHDRGAVLVAAIFDAFLSIYKKRTADLIRLSSGGTGILQPGEIHPDLAGRLANEAAKSAQHVLNMCVRAIDYCPPVDITFGSYLRAIITADHDLVANDDLNYRLAFLQAFRKRGIFPRDIRTLSVESLLLRKLDNEIKPPSNGLHEWLSKLEKYWTENIYTASREASFDLERKMRKGIHRLLKEHFKSPNGKYDSRFLGLDHSLPFEIRSARIAYRLGPDGGMMPQLLLSILQEGRIASDPKLPKGPSIPFIGGCSLVADLRESRIRYCITKSFKNELRKERQRAFQLHAADSLRSVYFGKESDAEPFAALHRGT